MVNICGPDEPHSSRKPFMGNRDVPVTNWSKRVRSSVLKEPIAWTVEWNEISLSEQEDYLGRTSYRQRFSVTTYLPEVLYDMILRCIAAFVCGMGSPVIDIDFSKTTDE